LIIHLDLPWTPAQIEQRIGHWARGSAGAHRHCPLYCALP
jgi:hypothetical protein